MRVSPVPEGLWVRPDGGWYIGDVPVAHGRILLFFKSHLVVEDEGAFVVDGSRRLPVRLEGPALEVVRLEVDPRDGSPRALLDDGSREKLSELVMDDRTGRFECPVREGRIRAVLSRGAHQALLEHAEEAGGALVLHLGDRRIPLRT